MDQVMLPRSRRTRPAPSRRPAAKTARRRAVPNLKVRRILVPLDFSEKANKALNYAIALADEMGARIILMHVVEPVYVSAEPGFTYVTQQTETLEQRAGRARMRKIADELIPEGLFDKAIVRLGSPYHEITTVARSLGVDLIVLATHGRTGLSHALMGSTAERVVRHAHCPVLTVRRTL